MKKFMIILCLMLLPAIGFTAEANPVIEIGSITVDGGQGHLAYSIGTEIGIKSTQAGFSNKLRTGYFQYQKYNPEAEGYYAWNITSQVLKPSWWDLYVAAGFGLINEVKNGDDEQTGGVMVELGAKAFNKVPFGIGVKVLPEDGAGDKAFVYGMLSIGL